MKNKIKIKKQGSKMVADFEIYRAQFLFLKLKETIF